jgi:carboxyl-terminal processing protease
MKKLLIKFVTYQILFIFLFVSTNYAEFQRKQIVLSKKILKSLRDWHYTPKSINNSFSEDAFNLYIKYLDSNKRFLIQPDIKKLTVYKNRIDDDLLYNKNSKLLKNATEILTQRIKDVEKMAIEILETPFNFDTESSIESDAKKRKFCADLNELKNRWRKILRHQTLLSYINLVKTKDIDKNKEAEKKKKDKTDKKITKIKIDDFKVFNAKLEKKAREEIKKSIIKSLNRLLKNNSEDYYSTYINSVANCFDPHSAFFPPQKKEDFDIDISGRLEGIGAMLQENDGFIKVTRIIPGSAAWKQKELKTGDLILKVAQGDEEAVDVVNTRVQDAVKLIRGKKGTKVCLTVKKPSNQIVVIPIIRDVVIIEETYAKSCVIKNTKLDKEYGYILLPSFYHDFNNNKNRNSTTDIIKELNKVKKDNISGLILDLRNNGGGSLSDAVNIVGLFIKKGPVVQIKNRYNICNNLEDKDNKIYYDGPLVVLINALSASASEILAAALQDYGRAIIIGGEHSYGKGTVQTFIDFDRTSGYKDLKPLGSIKLTIQKFYRINGMSTQYKGVIPDIVLPDTNKFLKIGEKELDHSLPWDSIKPLFYSKWQNQSDMLKIQENSLARVSSSPGFNILRKQIKKLDKQQKQTIVSLKLSDVLALEQEQEKDKEESAVLKKPIEYMYIPSANIHEKEKKLEIAKKESINEWYSTIKKDIFIDEAMNVLNDM